MISFTEINRCTLNDGVGRTKKYLQGGIDKLYLFPYVKYTRAAIYTLDNYLQAFPISLIFEFDVPNKNYQESTSNDKGGVFWNQDLSFDVPNTTPSRELNRLVKNDYRAIIKDRLGNYRILGLYNGLEASVTNETGVEKNSLNGYRIALKGKEQEQAYFLNDLSLFRQSEVENYLFEDGCNYIFEDETNYIF